MRYALKMIMRDGTQYNSETPTLKAAKNILREGLRILNEGSAGSAAPLKKPDSQSIDSRLAGTAYGVSPVAPAGGGSLGSGLASSVESGIPNLKSPFGD